MKETKDKSILTNASSKEVEDSIDNAEKSLKLVEKELNKIDKVLSKLPPQERFFIIDGLIGVLLNQAKLPPYMLSSIVSKYWFLSQLPYIQQNVTQNVQINKNKEVPNYLG